MKKILFITWDGPQTSYMEGLFMPIFHEVSKKRDIEFHVLQFTWGDKARTEITQEVAEKLNINYKAKPILRKPNVSIGSFIALLTSANKIRKYIKENKIDIVMPRSTFPAYWASKLKGVKIIFDADGLPIDERVEFGGLRKEGIMYRWLKSIETKMLNSADAVIVRSQKAINIHVSNIGEQKRNKFSVVLNGRDKNTFDYNETERNLMRKSLGINENELFLIYVGSLRGKYALKEILSIFDTIKQYVKTKLLFLTGDIDYLESKLSNRNSDNIIFQQVKSNDVPRFINAADVGLALIYPTYSMLAAVPTKLGEYLLCGIPTIASKGIGDTEEILQNFEESFLFDHDLSLESQLPSIIDYFKNSKDKDRSRIREKAIQFFSLEVAAESYLKAIEKVLKND